jgi:hypothetical protein
MAIKNHDASMGPPSPTVGSPIKPLTPEKDVAPPKKQLSSAQKASLARAREKARQSKLAKSQAKADRSKRREFGTKRREFVKFQAKPASPSKNHSDTAMSETESESSPSPVKHRKGKRKVIKKVHKKKRKVETSGDSETSEDDPADAQQRVKDHAALARQVYDNMARIKGEVVYKSLFPYLQG